MLTRRINVRPVQVALACIIIFLAAMFGVLASRGLEYFRQPYATEIQASLAQQFDYHAYGLQKGGTRFETAVIRPAAMSILRISYPKMWVWVHAYDARGRSVSGLAYFVIFDSDAAIKHPMMLTFDPESYLKRLRRNKLLYRSFSSNEVAHFQQLMEQ